MSSYNNKRKSNVKKLNAPQIALVALFFIILLSLIIGGISLLVNWLWPDSSGYAIWFVGTIIAVAAFLAALKDVIELIDKLTTTSKHLADDQASPSELEGTAKVENPMKIERIKSIYPKNEVPPDLEKDLAAARTQYLVKLDLSDSDIREKLDACLSEEELKVICFDLGIRFENLQGSVFTTRLASLILMLRQREKLNELVNWIKKHRSDIKF